MKISIEFLTEPNKGIKCDYESPTIHIGYLSSNDIVFEQSDDVSPNHAAIIIDNDIPTLYDHSAYGTYVDNNPIEKIVLYDGAIIQLGKNGPSFKVCLSDDESELPLYNSREEKNRRWYDRDALITKAMAILKDTKDDKAVKVANALIKLLNKQPSEVIFISSNIDVSKEIKELPQECRWYDLNKSVQKVVESLKLCAPEFKDEFTTQMIRMLENIDQEESVYLSSHKEFFNCSFCNYLNLSNSKFCSNCGGELNYKSKDEDPEFLRKCPQCNQTAYKSNKFCINCGHEFSDNQTQSELSSLLYQPEQCDNCGHKFETDLPQICNSCGCIVNGTQVLEIYKVLYKFKDASRSYMISQKDSEEFFVLKEFETKEERDKEVYYFSEFKELSIVPDLVNTFEFNNKHYYIRKFVPAETFSEKVMPANIQPRQFLATEVLRSILIFLDEVSKRNQVLGNITPESFLITEDNKIVLTKMYEMKYKQDYQGENISNSPPPPPDDYYPPEIYNHNKYIATSDLYSAALVVLYLMTKKPPAEYYNKEYEVFELKDEAFSVDLKKILLRMLETPAYRYNNYDEVLRDIDKLPFYSDESNEKNKSELPDTGCMLLPCLFIIIILSVTSGIFAAIYILDLMSKTN